jgi:hypothetical protein
MSFAIRTNQLSYELCYVTLFAAYSQPSSISYVGLRLLLLVHYYLNDLSVEVMITDSLIQLFCCDFLIGSVEMNSVQVLSIMCGLCSFSFPIRTLELHDYIHFLS